MILVKIALMVCLFWVFEQDIKERLVFWWLFPMIAILFSVVFLNQVVKEIYLQYVLMNLALVSGILLLLFAYSRFVLKSGFINTTFGLGDVLLFVALSFSFPTLAFCVLLSFSLVFSLMVHFVVVRKQKLRTIPLAGYMSLFFAVSLIFNETGFLLDLYLM